MYNSKYGNTIHESLFFASKSTRNAGDKRSWHSVADTEGIWINRQTIKQPDAKHNLAEENILLYIVVIATGFYQYDSHLYT